MPKILKIKDQKKCIGCELCIFEAQRQLKKVGIEGSLIRLIKNRKKESEFLEYELVIDPKINNLDINKIKNICPTEVFEISISDDQDFGN